MTLGQLLPYLNKTPPQSCSCLQEGWTQRFYNSVYEQRRKENEYEVSIPDVSGLSHQPHRTSFPKEYSTEPKAGVRRVATFPPFLWKVSHCKPARGGGWGRPFQSSLGAVTATTGITSSLRLLVPLVQNPCGQT